jgi:pimeloyl-ACP methyl ester carboxylesterase
MNATKIGLIGHSYGSYISAGSASQSKVDAVILTGFSGNFSYFGPFIAGAGFRVAKIQDPLRWGALDSAYLTSSDLYAETFAYYTAPYFEHRVAEWSYNVGSEPFALAELPPLNIMLSRGPCCFYKENSMSLPVAGIVSACLKVPERYSLRPQLSRRSMIFPQGM